MLYKILRIHKIFIRYYTSASLPVLFCVLNILDYINFTLQKCCCLLYFFYIQVQQTLTFPFPVSLSVLRQRFFCLLTDIVYSFNHACFHCWWLCQYILMNEEYIYVLHCIYKSNKTVYPEQEKWDVWCCCLKKGKWMYTIILRHEW